MNEIQIFNNPQFGNIRTAGTPESPLFCLADVCKALELRQGDVVRRIDKGVVSTQPLETAGGTQMANFVNEDGLYDVILDSRKPEARTFRKWITSEVLPSIRKTGKYSTGVPQSFAEALMLAAKQQMEIEEKEKKIAAMNEEQERLLIENTKKDVTINEQGEQIIKLSSDIIKMQPKVDYCDIILQSNSTVLITQIAQDYGMSAVSFNKKLAEMRIQHRVNNQWILYAPFISMGYVQSKPVNIPLPDGSTKVRLNTEWTQKGRLFLYEKLKSNNIIPLIEQNLKQA